MDDRIPPFLTVEEASRLLKIGRTKAYLLTKEWRATGGRSGLAVVDLGDVLRVPGPAIEQMLGIGPGAPYPTAVRSAGKHDNPTMAPDPTVPGATPTPPAEPPPPAAGKELAAPATPDGEPAPSSAAPRTTPATPSPNPPPLLPPSPTTHHHKPQPPPHHDHPPHEPDLPEPHP